MWIHRTREFRCEHCETPFSTIAKLNDHRRKFHKPDTPFVCNQCGKGTFLQRVKYLIGDEYCIFLLFMISYI